MHVPDGFINAPVSVAAGVAAAGAVAVSLRGARREFGGEGFQGAPGAQGAQGAQGTGSVVERTAPLAGLVAAFIFAVQMLNFPVAAGTSGHLLGGALAAVLVGPYTGVLCVSVVLLMQGVLFADGGLTALGVNILVMGVVTVLAAYGTFRVLLRLLPRARRSVTGAAFAAALISVPTAAVAFTGLYALGGTADVELGRVFAAMVGVHVLIGIGEAAITAATVGAVVAVRPDLVHGARDLASRTLELRTAPVVRPGGAAAPRTGPAADSVAQLPEQQPAAAPAPVAAPAGTNRRVWLGGLAATVLCAGVISFYASASPDGLEKVAADNGIDKRAQEHAAKDSPLADYGIENIADTRLSGGLAGVIGAAATLAAGSGVFVAVRRRQPAAAGDDAVHMNSPVSAGTYRTSTSAGDKGDQGDPGKHSDHSDHGDHGTV
jgi:cobalt/nickel transport system permease protein